jgi:hypothetical protein
LLEAVAVVKVVLLETEAMVVAVLVDIEREPHHLTQLNLMRLLLVLVALLQVGRETNLAEMETIPYLMPLHQQAVVAVEQVQAALKLQKTVVQVVVQDI